MRGGVRQGVLTVLGTDRPGLVDALSEWVSEAGGNWQNSHFSHVGEWFAGILEVRVPVSRWEEFVNGLAGVEDRTGLTLMVRSAEPAAMEGEVIEMRCLGQDRPGIVRAVTDILVDFHANVESLDTCFRDAPMSGEVLFEAVFRVRLPEEVDLDALEERVSGIGEELMLDVRMGG